MATIYIQNHSKFHFTYAINIQIFFHILICKGQVDTIQNITPIDSSENQIQLVKMDLTKNYLSSIPSILPLKNLEKNYLISSFFKERLHPIHQKIKMHLGIDLSAPLGTPIYATADGTVQKLYNNSSSIGYAIKIKHLHNYSTLYGHLIDLPNLSEGEKVKRGQIIAFVGNTGTSSGPHLHYCIYYKGHPINPYEYLTLAINTPNKAKKKTTKSHKKQIRIPDFPSIPKVPK